MENKKIKIMVNDLEYENIQEYEITEEMWKGIKLLDDEYDLWARDLKIDLLDK